MKKKLSIGVIGLGIGGKHLDAFYQHPDCEVRSICDFDDAKLKKYEQLYPEIATTKEAGQIIDDDRIDVVSIASYDDHHFSQVVGALENDKHVFVEKPLCLFEEEAVRIKQILNAKELKMSSNMVLRTCPRFINLKNELTMNKFGDVYYIEGDYYWGRVGKLTDGWRKKMDYYSIIYGASIHLIDLINWLTGKHPIQVKGYGNKTATRHSDFRFNDFSVLIFKYPDDMIVKVSAHGGCIHPHFHNLKVFGTNKTFINNLRHSFWLDTPSEGFLQSEDNQDYPAKEKRDGIITSFIDSILYEDKIPAVDKEDVFSAMSICFAAEKSIQKNESVVINYI